MDLIYVAGMHRSGTSAVTRVLSLLGVYLGPAEALLPAQDDNPRGFWEAGDVMVLNNRLLGHLGGAWDRPPVLDLDRLEDPALSSWYDEAEEIVTALTKGTAAEAPQLFGMKDPRFSLLLPFWSRRLPAARVVLPLRPPDSVALSLASRNGFSRDHSAGLWIRHVADTVRYAPDALRVFYDDLLADPRAESRRLATELGLPVPDEETLASIDDFLSADLDHSDDDVEGEETPLVRLAAQLYDGLRAGDRAADELARALSLTVRHGAAPGHELRAELNASTTKVAALEQRVSGLQVQQTELRSQVANLRQAMASSQQRRQRLRVRVDRLEKVRDSQASRLEHRAVRIARLRDQRDRARANLQRLRSRRSVRVALKLADTAGRLARRQ